MRTEIKVFSQFLKYEQDIELFTALSGRVTGIASLYLLIERSDGFRAVSEIRANMEYYNGLPEAAVLGALDQYISKLNWDRSVDELLNDVDAVDGHPVAQCAVEGALLEGLAIAGKTSVAKVLGGTWRERVVSNNSLMWCDFPKFERLADRFVRDGFKTLKVRIAVKSFDEDLKRIAHLRERFGDSGIAYGVDVNCQWRVDEAIERINALAELGVSFVEQPTAPGDWGALEAIRRKTAVPIIVDEGCQTQAEVERLARMGPPFMAHLKMLKLGGPRGMVRAARTLLEGGVRPIIGQMNEGMAATALAAQCAMAVPENKVTELYGFYGLMDEPVSGLRYDNGAIVIRSDRGSGFEFNERLLQPVLSIAL